MALYLDGCAVQGSDLVGNKVMNQVSDALMFMHNTSWEGIPPTNGAAWYAFDCNYWHTRSGVTFIGQGQWDGGSLTATSFTDLTISGSDAKNFRFTMSDLPDGSGSGFWDIVILGAQTGLVSIKLDGSTSASPPGINAFAGCGPVYLDGYFRRVAVAGTNEKHIRVHGLDQNCDITGPAFLDIVATTAAAGPVKLTLRGAGIRGDLHLSGSASPHLALVACKRSLLAVSFAGSGQGYTIDASSDHNVLIVTGLDDVANFFTASVNSGASNMIIDWNGAPPTGAAGGSLSGTYPNPTFAGRDASVDAINKDLLPAALITGPEALGVFEVAPYWARILNGPPAYIQTPNGMKAQGVSAGNLTPQTDEVGAVSDITARWFGNRTKIGAVGPGSAAGMVAGTGGATDVSFWRKAVGKWKSDPQEIPQIETPDVIVNRLGAPAQGVTSIPPTSTGVAGGSLTGTYPNPTFAGRDSSVDKLNQDMLPAMLWDANGVTQVPAAATSGAAGGSLAGSYPNPTFAGRDSSVDKLTQDMLPSALWDVPQGVSVGGLTGPYGAAGGDLVGAYPNPSLAASGVTAATYGQKAGSSPQFTVDAKGRLTSASEYVDFAQSFMAMA